MRIISGLDDQNLKHARQAQKRRSRQKRNTGPATAIDLPDADLRCVDAFEDVRNAIRQPPDNENADRQKRGKLHHRLDRNRHHNAVVPFVRIQISGAEEDGKNGKTDRNPKGRARLGIAPARHAFRKPENLKAERHRLQLQSDIGRCPQNEEDRHAHGKEVRLAITRRNKISDRGDALAASDAHQLSHRPEPADHHKAWPQIDRHIFNAVSCSRAHRAVKRPRGTVNRQRQRIDHGRAQPTHAALHRGSFSHEGHNKKEKDVGQTNGQKGVERGHCCPSRPP